MPIALQVAANGCFLLRNQWKKVGGPDMAICVKACTAELGAVYTSKLHQVVESDTALQTELTFCGTKRRS